jgi:hypothetical protein
VTSLSKFEKYLVYKFSSKNYASVNEVPDSVPLSQLHYAKDKGRARMVIILLGVTVLGAMVSIFLGKRDHGKGKRYTDDMVRQHAQYNKNFQELARAIPPKE